MNKKKIILVIFLYLTNMLSVSCRNKIIEKNTIDESEKPMVIIGETYEESEKNVSRNEKYVDGEVLVMIKKGYENLDKCNNSLLKNAKEIFRFNDDNKDYSMIVLVKDDKLSTDELIEKLKDLPEVKSVEPNYSLNINNLIIN